MMHYTNNPAKDAENYFDSLPEVQEERQHCEYCECEIEGKYAYEINGVLICPDCLMEYLDGNCRVPVGVTVC